MKNGIRWSVRILAFAFILFLMAFSLDVFEEGRDWTQILLGLFMHNIPAFILIGIVLLAWKHPIIGAVAFALAGLAYAILLLVNEADFALNAILFLSLPSFIIGCLYGLDAYLSKKMGNNNQKNRFY